jgi:hypothetical protein
MFLDGNSSLRVTGACPAVPLLVLSLAGRCNFQVLRHKYESTRSKIPGGFANATVTYPRRRLPEPGYEPR